MDGAGGRPPAYVVEEAGDFFSLDVSEGGNTLGVLEGGEMFRMFIEGEERRGEVDETQAEPK